MNLCRLLTTVIKSNLNRTLKKTSEFPLPNTLQHQKVEAILFLHQSALQHCICFSYDRFALKSSEERLLHSKTSPPSLPSLVCGGLTILLF